MTPAEHFEAAEVLLDKATRMLAAYPQGPGPLREVEAARAAALGVMAQAHATLALYGAPVATEALLVANHDVPWPTSFTERAEQARAQGWTVETKDEAPPSPDFRAQQDLERAMTMAAGIVSAVKETTEFEDVEAGLVEGEAGWVATLTWTTGVDPVGLPTGSDKAQSAPCDSPMKAALHLDEVLVQRTILEPGPQQAESPVADTGGVP